MNCECSTSVVEDSRQTREGRVRRRSCPKCRRRWTTIEVEVTDIKNGETVGAALIRMIIRKFLTSYA